MKKALQSALMGYLQEYNREDVSEGFALVKDLAAILAEKNHSSGSFLVSIMAESDEDMFYDVYINFSGQLLETECTCSDFGANAHCKHVAAGIIEILDGETNLDLDQIEKQVAEAQPTASPQASPATLGRVVSLYADQEGDIPWQTIIAEPGNAFYAVYERSAYQRSNVTSIRKIKLLSENTAAASWQFGFKADSKSTYIQDIHFDRNNKFRYRCSCNTRSPMCYHVKTAFDWLEEKHGRSYFTGLKDWSQEKAKLLDAYGLKPEDDEARDISFTIDYAGKLQMTVPDWLWGKNAENNIVNFKKLVHANKEEMRISERPAIAGATVIDFNVGFLFNLLSQHFKTGFELEPIRVFVKPSGETYKKLSVHNPSNLPLLKELPDEIYELVTSLSDEAVKKYLANKGYNYVNSYSNPWVFLTGETLKVFHQYYFAQLRKLWPYLCSHPHVYVLKEGNFNNRNILPVKCAADPVCLEFRVEENERFITIWQLLIKNENPMQFENVQLHSAGIFIIDGVLHLTETEEDHAVLMQFRHGFIKIPVANKLSVITNIIPALQKKYKVRLPPSLQLNTIEMDPQPQLLIKEYTTQYLMLQPQFVYEAVTVDYETNPKDILHTLPDGSYQVIQRHQQKEKAFFENIRLLHSQFQRQTQNDFFYLPFDEVMKKNWFIDTVRRLQESDIPVLGMQELKRFRYNTNKPTWDMKAGSGIDWFDLTIAISFGDQSVPLKEVRKALSSKQNMVVLGDGTIGVLPEEWLKQYGLLLKLADEQKDGTLRLSKLHYTLIDELHGAIDDKQVMQEIEEKKQKLRQVEDLKTVKISKQITASLRPYQLSGFHWLQTLDGLGWGGCLADDMGLGKTLQAIAFLQFLKETYAGSTHLVICPTSLIYNWESELKKFAPSITYHIYYGTAREFSNEHFEDYDIIITSYGIIRNDLQQLLQFQWHYVILDESQAIKNPDALTTKAVQLLKSKNRLILSGTPVQNNTFDLYAQFNFINPGLLGNREFYKELANGIDKYNDPEKAAQLRRMVYPFMLRRTKEQVATDLPEKTETVLWCEMPKEQRAVYDDYKNHYKNSILKKIEEVGMGKAGMYILEGLLRLRQICDSPLLVKSEEVTTSKSVKIDELMREVQENTGQHKILVFSQFTEMLALIKARMEESGLAYVYLDGSTPALDRKKAVENFQTNTAVKVFLISLKAGGVGLNLTAADYIYIVDPWWNPAVEQQAIDRTHRIGQKNKIFAYKMICKNTIEEKIIELQQKKKQIASDLVTEDAGFIKKLKKEDVEFLFN